MDDDRNLTTRESTLLALVASGLTNRQIARHVQLCEKTVKNHLTAVFLKIGAADRTQAAIYALGRAPAREPAGPEPGDDVLTPREQSVLSLVASGLTNRQIARHLKISEKTVKNHLTAIFPKIGASDRTQAAIYAIGRPWCQTA